MIQVQMTDAEFAAKAAELERTFGVSITERVGTVSKDGVTAGYTHHDGTLTIHILDKPAFISRAYCERRVEEWLALSEDSVPK